MIGSRIEARPRFPYWATLLLLIAAGLFVGAFTGNAHLAIGALLPACWAAGLLLSRPRPLSFTVASEALRFDGDDPVPEVRYEDIQGLFPVGRPKLPGMKGPEHFALRIAHPDGVIAIPKSNAIPSDDLYRFLCHAVPPGGDRPLPPTLAEHRDREVQTFGADRVWSYGAANHLASKSRMSGVRGGTIGVMVGAVCWMVAGGVLLSSGPGGDSGKGWIGAGGGTLFYAFLVFLTTFASGADRTSSYVKKWRKSGLVISPTGLALSQGGVEGHVPWDGLREIRVRDRARTFRLTSNAPAGITLVVAGADVLIADVYERPIATIYDRIDEYWRE